MSATSPQVPAALHSTLAEHLTDDARAAAARTNPPLSCALNSAAQAARTASRAPHHPDALVAMCVAAGLAPARMPYRRNERVFGPDAEHVVGQALLDTLADLGWKLTPTED